MCAKYRLLNPATADITARYTFILVQINR